MKFRIMATTLMLIWLGTIGGHIKPAHALGTPIEDNETGGYLPCGCGDFKYARRRLEELLVALDNIPAEIQTAENIVNQNIQRGLGVLFMDQGAQDSYMQRINTHVNAATYSDEIDPMVKINFLTASATYEQAGGGCNVYPQLGAAGCLKAGLFKHENKHLMFCRTNNQFAGEQNEKAYPEGHRLYPWNLTADVWLGVEKLGIEEEIRFLRRMIREMTAPGVCPELASQSTGIMPRSQAKDAILKILPLKAAKEMMAP